MNFLVRAGYTHQGVDSMTLRQMRLYVKVVADDNRQEAAAIRAASAGRR